MQASPISYGHSSRERFWKAFESMESISLLDRVLQVYDMVRLRRQKIGMKTNGDGDGDGDGTADGDWGGVGMLWEW